MSAWIRGGVTIILTGAVVYLWITAQTPPEALLATWTGILGTYWHEVRGATARKG